MGAALLKLLVLSVCLNTFLYLGVNYGLSENILEKKSGLQEDLFDILLTDPLSSKNTLRTYVEGIGTNNTAGYDFELEGNFSNPPTEKSGLGESEAVSGSNIFSFLDGLRMIKGFLVTLWRIATMPLTLFTYGVLPPLVAYIIGIPLLLLNITTLIVLIRGGGAI